jgi:hypothetical protein
MVLYDFGPASSNGPLPTSSEFIRGGEVCYDAELAASNANKGELQFTWNPGFETKKATLKIGAGDRLEVTVKTHFTDSSGRPDYETVDY